MTQSKELAWARAEASDESRCDTLSRLEEVRPKWKEAQAERKNAEESLLDGQTAAREKFPINAYDEETSHALNNLGEDYDSKTADFRRLESRKRSLDDTLKKLTENTLTLIGEARDPGLWAGGKKLGPDGWKLVLLRDLVGSPDPTKDLEKQTWTSEELEKAGYHNVGEFVKGRDRLIPALMDDAELASDTVRIVDAAVYRYLEKRELLDKWPKTAGIPAGAQLTLETSPADNGLFMDDAGNGHTLPHPKEKLASTASYSEICLKLHPTNAERDTKNLIDVLDGTFDGLQDMIQREGDEKIARLDKGVVQKLSKSITNQPLGAYHVILGLLENGDPLPETGISEGTWALIWQTVVSYADEQSLEGELADPVTSDFARRVCALGGDAVAQVAQWSEDLGSLVAAFQLEAKSGTAATTPKPKPTVVKPPAKKKAKSKPAVKKKGKKPAKKNDGARDAG